MVDLAVVLAHRALRGRRRVSSALLNAGGLTLLERLLRQLRRLGIPDVILYVDGFEPELRDALKGFDRIPDHVRIAAVPADLSAALPQDGTALVLDGGGLVDERLLRLLMKDDVNGFDHMGTPHGLAPSFRMPAVWLKEALAANDDAPLTERLAQRLKTEGRLIDARTIDTYVPDRRRTLPLLGMVPAHRRDRHAAAAALMATAQKGALDWPARFIHAPIEDWIVRLLLPFPVSPNMVTAATAVIGFIATWLFATGSLSDGLAMALIVGVLDGVDGKLARVKMMTSPWGELEHIVDKIVEYSWYLALAYFLSKTRESGVPWALGLGIILFAWAEVVQSEFYRRMTGRQIDDAGRTERVIRIFSARRNTMMWLMIPFAFFDMWYDGYIFMAVFSTLTFFVAQWRFVVRVKEFLSRHCPQAAVNFMNTRYL